MTSTILVGQRSALRWCAGVRAVGSDVLDRIIIIVVRFGTDSGVSGNVKVRHANKSQ